MANESYTGVPTVAPDVRQPDDYQRVQSSPANFGGLIAQGAEAAGKGALDLSKFWGQIQTDQVLNDKLKEGDAAVEQFGTLRGQDALDAQAGVKAHIESLRQSGSDLLKTPEQQLEFDRQMRPYIDRLWAGKISTHADQQGYVHAKSVNADAFTQTLNQVASIAPDNPMEVENLKGAARVAAIKQITLDGQHNDPVAMSQAIQRADSAVYKTAAEAMAVKDPQGALQYAEIFRTQIGLEAPALLTKLQVEADRHFGDRGNAAANSAVDSGYGAKPQTNYLGTRPPDFVDHPAPGQILRADQVPAEYVGSGVGGTTPTPSAAQQQVATATAAAAPQFHQVQSEAIANAIHGQESGGAATSVTSVDNAHGGWQIQPGTFKQYAQPGEKLDDPKDNEAVGRRIIADYTQKYRDPERVAVAYFSGPGNVAPPGSPTPWLRDAADGNGKRTSSYVSDVMHRLGHAPSVPTENAPPAGRDELGPAGPRPSISASDFSVPATSMWGNEPESVTATPASLTSPAPIIPEQPPAPVAPPEPTESDVQARLAKKEAFIRDQDWSVGQKESVLTRAKQERDIALLSMGANKQAREDAANAAGADYTKRVLSGHIDPNILQEIASDPRYANNGRAMQEMADYVTKWTGKEPTAAFGKDWQQARTDMLSSPGTPGHISDFQEVYRRSVGGDITPRGISDLYQMKARNAKDVDSRSYELIANSFLEGAKKKLSFDGEGAAPGFEGLRDPVGVQKYYNEFQPRYMLEFADQLQHAKETGDATKLREFLTEKRAGEIVKSIRPPGKMLEALISAGQTIPPEPAGAPLPPVPEGSNFNPAGWSNIMTSWKSNHQVLADMVQRLIAQPDFAPQWDKRMTNAAGVNVMPAKQVFSMLGVEQPLSRGAEVRKPDTTFTPAAPKSESKPAEDDAFARLRVLGAHLGIPDIGHMSLEQLKERFMPHVGGPLPVYPSTQYQDEHRSELIPGAK